jgi:Xaa-Pro aminopeptidase
MTPNLSPTTVTARSARPPQEFLDLDRLDESLAEAGIDVLLLSSRHNVAYALDGHRFHFFDGEDALGKGRYTPVLGYIPRRLDQAFYLANLLENHQIELAPIWIEDVEIFGWPGDELAEPVARRLRAGGLENATVGVELGFLPASVYLGLARALPGARFVNAHAVIEDLRAVKRPEELDLLRRSSDLIVDAMLAAWNRCHAGISTRAAAQILREEETARGLVFDHVLITTGSGHLRAPSELAWESPWPLNLDSGGRLAGYIGDLARNGVLGAPTALQTELLEEVDAVQLAVRRAIRPGVLARELYAVAGDVLRTSPNREQISFAAHGVGLVNHEAPRISSAGPVVYPAAHGHRPLEPGMVISVETTLPHAVGGYVKLEDTIFVTEDGFEAVGDGARGWNVVAV